MFMIFDIDGLPAKIEISDTLVLGCQNEEIMEKACSKIRDFINNSTNTRKKIKSKKNH